MRSGKTLCCVLCAVFFTKLSSVGAVKGLILKFVNYEFKGANNEICDKIPLEKERDLATGGEQQAPDLYERFGDHLAMFYSAMGNNGEYGACSLMFSLNMTMTDSQDTKLTTFGGRYQMMANTHKDECFKCVINACFDNIDSGNITLSVDAGHYAGQDKLPKVRLSEAHSQNIKLSSLQEIATTIDVEFDCEQGKSKCKKVDNGKNFKLVFEVQKTSSIDLKDCAGGLEHTTDGDV